jgi:hypothetical protein
MRPLRPAPLVLFAAVAALAPLAAACSDGAHRNAWCSMVTSGNAAFDTKTGLDADALRDYRRIEAAAPPEIRPSLRTARINAVAFWEGDAARFRDDPKRLEDFERAKARVDRYLERECGIDRDPRGGEGS